MLKVDFLLNYLENSMDALILAGGENKRIRFHKGLLEFNGRRIIETTSEILKKYFNKMIISTNNPEQFYYLGYQMIGDVFDYRGPMTGIFSVFFCSGVSEIFVVACDMPFINGDLIDIIINNYNGQDAVIPVFNATPQPLLGIYSSTIMCIMEQRIKVNKRSMMSLLNNINTHFIKEEEIVRVDPEGRSFVNINTIEEYEKVIRKKVKSKE